MALNQAPRVSTSISRKINLGNYESVDFHVSISMDIADPDFDIDQIDKMLESLEEYMSSVEKRARVAARQQPVSIFDGIATARKNGVR